MKEIRVRWPFGLHENDRGEPTDGGVWFPDTPEIRKDLTIVVQTGCEVAGEGSHWLEERDA
jgi:hypothetical protein